MHPSVEIYRSKLADYQSTVATAKKVLDRAPRKQFGLVTREKDFHRPDSPKYKVSEWLGPDEVHSALTALATTFNAPHSTWAAIPPEDQQMLREPLEERLPPSVRRGTGAGHSFRTTFSLACAALALGIREYLGPQ